MGLCRGDETWLGAEIGLSRYTLKFPNRLDETGYAKNCSARLKRNLLVSMSILSVMSFFIEASYLPDFLVPDRQVLWLKHASIGSLFMASSCYIIIHLVPSLYRRTSMFGREVFGVCACIGCLATPRDYYLRDSEGQQEILRTFADVQATLVTVMILTGSHLLVPVRWHVLIVLEMHACLWHPFWITTFVTRQGYMTWYLHFFQCVIVLLFVMGKRHTECTERYLFRTLLSEKVMRVTSESRLQKLEQEQEGKPKGPGSVVSSKAAFDNLGMSDDMKREVDRVVKLGKLEHWILEGGVVVDETKVLGRGGFGLVCCARLHGTPAVVKIALAPMQAWIGPRASHLAALGNEIRILRRLRHPNIVLFHGAVVLGGEDPTDQDAACGPPQPMRLGLVLELVEGQVLADFAKSCFPECLLFVTVDVCRALRFLHAQSPAIVHGDLKPGNVMVRDAGKRPRTKLIDFGLARRVTPDASPPGGTQLWIAPEQLLNGSILPTETLDIFAFGSIVYFMEVGNPPMAGVSKQSDMLQDPMNQLPWPEAPSRCYLSSEARKQIQACLTVCPAFRPASFNRMQDVLEFLVAEDGMPATALTSSGTGDITLSFCRSSESDLASFENKILVNFGQVLAAKFGGNVA